MYFTRLLSVGTYPVLKQNYVVPIFKSGSKNDVRNYRSIAIQPTLAKIYEGLVLDSLYFYLGSSISPHQHGFRGRSSATNLLVFQEYIMSAFWDSSQVDCVYLDFSKAFDKVNHRLLVAKMEGYGVSGSLLGWIRSYLSDRVLIVKCDGGYSQPFPVLSGVPQGSYLGPLPFAVYINDISKVIQTHFFFFADEI